RLNGVQRRSDRHCVAKCPAHDDQKPSLSIRLTNEGKVLLKCHAGCTANDVMSALRLSLRDLSPRSPSSVSSECCYDYVDEEGNLLFQVIRKAGKEFRCRKRDAQGNWTYSLGDTRRVLYRLPDLLQAPPTEVIWVPE